MSARISGRARTAYEKAETVASEPQRAVRQVAEPTSDDGVGDELEEDIDEAA
jgi:hypothetical protein